MSVPTRTVDLKFLTIRGSYTRLRSVECLLRLKIILVQFIARDCPYNTRWLCTPSAVWAFKVVEGGCLLLPIYIQPALFDLWFMQALRIHIINGSNIIYIYLYAHNTFYYNIYYTHWITMTVALYIYYIQYTCRKSGQRCVGIDR